MKFCFGDIVVVEGSLIGVVVKSWTNPVRGTQHEVYVRMYHGIREYDESQVERYMVRHKYLDDQEIEWQRNATRG